MSNNKSKNLVFYERLVLIILASICGFLIILKLFRIDNLFGKEIDYAWVSNVLLLTIIVHFIISSFKFQNNSTHIVKTIDISQTNIIESIRGVEKRNFSTITEVDIYVAKRIREAEYTVLDLNWQDFKTSTPSHSQQNREITDDEIDKSIKTFCKKRRNAVLKEKSIYEEIFTFPPSNKTNLQKMKNHTKYGDIYCCYFYETLKELKFPKLQFVIIDDKEVIFVSSEYNGNFCAIKDKKIVNICLNYFMQARELSTVIKDKNKSVNQELIAKIERKYK